MFNDENFDKLEKILDKALGNFRGTYMLVTVVGSHEVKLSRMGPMPVHPDMEMADIDVGKEPKEVFEEKPFRRIVNTKGIDTVWEHEKGSVIRIGGSFNCEELIVSEKIEYIAAQCGMDVK